MRKNVQNRAIMFTLALVFALVMCGAASAATPVTQHQSYQSSHPGNSHWMSNNYYSSNYYKHMHKHWYKHWYWYKYHNHWYKNFYWDYYWTRY